MVSRVKQAGDSELVFAKDADDTALNFDVVGGHHDGSHVGICRLQTNLTGAFAIEALEGCFFADQRHDDVARIGDLGLLAHHEVAVHDVIVVHGSAFDLQDKRIAATREIAQRYRLALFHGLQRTSRRDPSHQGKFLHLAIGYLLLDRLRQLDNLDGAALIVTAANEAFFLKRGDVFVHGGQGGELKALANFFKAWRVAMLGLKRDEVIENFLLPFGQSHVHLRLQVFSIGTLGEKKANVKRVFRFALLSPPHSAVPLEMIYRHSVGNLNKRSASVTAAAVVAILSGLLLLMVCSIVFFGSLMMKLPGTTPELPPFARNAMLATQSFMLALSIFGLATGIGLIYLRNWARISVLIWGGFSVFFGLIGIPIAFFTQFPPNPSSPALPAETIQGVRWALLGIYGIPLLIGIWWLILFNRKSVKAQFARQGESADQGPRKLACPLPIAVLAWFYVASVLNLLFLPLLSFHLPLFVFGRVLPGSTGGAVLMLSSLVFAIAGIGLLKLKPWSYSLTIGLQLFWLASAVASMLTPNYSTVMDSYMKEVQASFHLPEAPSYSFNFALHFGWIMVGGLVFAGAILGLLVYYRPRFLEEASRAAS